MDWRIISIAVKDEDGKTNVAKEVTFAVSKTSGDEVSERTGKVNLKSPTDSFIEYNDLTQNDVVGWVQSSLGLYQINKLERSIDDELAEIKLSNIGLPW